MSKHDPSGGLDPGPFTAVMRARCYASDKRRLSVLRMRWNDARRAMGSPTFDESDLIRLAVRALLEEEGVEDPGERRRGSAAPRSA